MPAYRARLAALVVAAVLCLTAGLADASTWIIRADGSGDFATIQAGVTAATAGDTIQLEPGTFTGVGNREIDTMGKALVIISASGAETTIINCEGMGRGLVFANGESDDTELIGVTITNGSSSVGGAVYMDNSSPVIRNCVITACSSSFDGGAIYMENSSPIINNCEITGNFAGGNGGAIATESGGIATITVNNIHGNTATISGGGVYARQASPDLNTNKVWNNGAINGGGIYLENSFASIQRTTVVENTTVSSSGAGLLLVESQPTVATSIIAFNNGGEGITCAGVNSLLTISCSVVFGNSGGDTICGASGGNNQFVDPEFCGVLGTGNLLLQSDSPAWSGNNTCGLIMGAEGIGCSTVSTRETSVGGLKGLFRGKRK